MFSKLLILCLVKYIISTLSILLIFIIKAQGFSIAFGSCLHQEKELGLLLSAKRQNPNAFIFLGDNVYADSNDSMKINAAYQSLACNANFQALKASVPIFATWDDHDYGMDDAGKYYPLKAASKRIFTSFFIPVKQQSKINSHAGIYQSYCFRFRGRKIQLILLDTRTFRSDLRRINKDIKDDYYPYDRLYVPTNQIDSSILGDEQWTWLEEALSVKSALTIIASSTQFATEYNGYEAWANFPKEQERLINLIESNKKEHVVLISGDVHYGELSAECNAPYPLYDLTSSGISESWGFAAPNAHREEGPVMENNYGQIRFMPWKRKISFEIYTEKGLRFQRLVDLKSLEFK